ncbi:unnamed protein product [Rodentolepis nana]|uniref:Uncharacterized protein n=1 Tax=Rodentolepis nana TaxID=102285 RepID=A0A3P7RUM1_RODNA|nr:unnamed protein product [Rodentolepis nana]
MGINDVDSLNLELRNAVAHATKDSHRGLKIRDVQSQIITRTSSESAWTETQGSSEVQTQIGVMSRTAAIQAVAKMGVVNIPSHNQKNRVVEGTSTTFCLLPDKESTGTMNSEVATSDVMTQISCILHSRGIHSDLQTYLSEYKKRSSLSATSDLGEQNVEFQWEKQPKSEIRNSTATCDVETLISRVVHDYGTQVSSRLIPTEVTVNKISTKEMAVSLGTPLKDIEIGLPIDSLICPSDMKFETELYEGSDLSIADYSGVSNFIVTHDDGVVTGSMHLNSVDAQTGRGLTTQAAVVLRAKDFRRKVAVGEITAQSGVAPKVNFVISNVAGRPFRDSKTPTSDLQTQIRSSNLLQENVELVNSEVQVGLELVPTQISMKRYDIEKMEVEFLDATGRENYNMKMNSVSCPAKIKVESRLTEGSGVHISGIEKASRVVISVSGSLPSVQTDVREKVENEDSDILHEEFKTEVNFEHISMNRDERKRCSSKSTQRNVVRLIPCGVSGSKMMTSGETSQVLSVTSDASMQVGSRLVPLAIGVSPVQLENMEISLTNLGKPISGQMSSASAVLYPAQVELQSTLVDGQNGIELVPIEQLEYINLNSSRSEAMVQYSSSSSDVITQIITPERPNLLPASIIMETGQFDGHHRMPNIASQSLVCDLLSNRMRNQTVTIKAKPATSDYSSGKPSSYLGYVSTEANTQTADTSIENMEEDSIYSADRRVKQYGIGVQVGTKLIPEVLKLSQIPVKNMKLESVVSSSGHKERISLQSIRCPAEIALKSELCDDSGIVICSLDQSGEIEVEMARDSPESQIQVTSKSNKVHGWWSGIVNGKTPLFENKSLDNSSARKSTEKAVTTSKQTIRIENNLSLQGEAILQPETYSTHPNPRYRLVMVDTGNQNRSATQRNSTSPDRQYSSVSASKLDWSDRGVQVGVKLIPNSIDVRPLKLENMKAVLSSKKTRDSREVDASAVLCTSGVQYEEELTESTGVQVVQINESAELSLCYCGDKFVTSVVSANRNTSVIGSTDGSKHFDVGSITARNADLNTTSDADDSNFVTILRVKEAQYGTKNNRTAGYWESTKMPNGEISFIQNRIQLVDKNVQVGLNLVPKTITVDKVSVENMEAISGQRKDGTFEEVSVGAMLYSRPTQYDHILTESKGVNVLPIRDVHDVRVGYKGDIFYTSVDSTRDLIEASYSESRSDWPRLRVHHLEFSDEVSQIGKIDRSRESSKVEAMTQVGTVLVPTELKLEQMSLDAHQVPRLVESISTENILCPTDIAASSILSECSGVHITSVGALSEIAIKLDQGEYKAEVQRDTKSNQTRIAIKERSISAKRSHASGYISLIEPSISVDDAHKALTFGGISNSIQHSMSSKSVQVGTILVPTTVTMEKVMVENLEVSVPLTQSKCAEVNVSAVLASSATEMTTVLTNAPGIHVIPMSKVDEIGIQANGKNYIGMVEGAYQSPRGRAPSGISVSQDQQKIILPIASSAINRSTNIQASLLQQSADLSLLHDTLRSGQTTPVLRETNTFSTGSFRRPGIIHIPGQTLTPIAEILSTPSHSAPKDVMDSSVQVGVRLIPHAISLQRDYGKSMASMPSNLSEKEIDFHNFLMSSEFQYDMMLQETVGVDVVPIKYAEKVNITLDGENFTTEIGSIRSDRRYGSLDHSRRLLERTLSTPLALSDSSSQRLVHAGDTITHQINPPHSSASRRSVVRYDQGTQVGVILLPQQLNLERMNLKSGTINSATVLSESRTPSLLYPTNIGVDVALSETPGFQMADFGGEMLVDFGDSSYNAKVSRTASSAEASVHLIDESVSLGRKSSILEISLSRNLPVTPVTLPSGEVVRRYTVSTGTQVGTLLIPTKVYMNQVDVENLAVEIPLTEWKSTDLNVSAILATTGTEMTTVLSEDTGIQIVDMKDLEEVGIQYGDEVYVAGVTASKPKYIGDSYGPVRDHVTSSTSNKRREVIVISVPKNLECVQLNQKATNLLKQSSDLREIHSTLSSSVSQPRLRMGSVLGTPIHLGGQMSSQQPMTGIINQSPIMTCECGRQYTVGELERQLISIESGASGALGRVNSQFSTNKLLRHMETANGTFSSQDRDAAEASSQNRVYESYNVTCEAAIKPTMVSKRLTANIQPVGIEAGCQVSTYEVDYSMDTRLSRNQLSQLTTDDMTSDLMDTPNLLRRSTSKKRTHSEDSHGRPRTANICSSCRNRMMITDISTADPDDPSSYEASIRIRRVSNADTFDNSVASNFSRGSTLRRSFFTRGSEKRSSGSFESLRSHSQASRCAICRNEITSGDLSSSIRTSTSSLLGGTGVVAVRDSGIHEIADAYAQICKEADQSDGVKANLYLMLRGNKIIQAIIDDYLKEKKIEEVGYFAESKEILEVVSANEKAMKKARKGDKTIYSQLQHNSLTRRVIDSYECYKHSMRVDEFIQVNSTPFEGGVETVSDAMKEIMDVVDALKDAEGQVGEKTIYAELKGNAIIQRVIKEYEMSRLAHTAIRRPTASSRLANVVFSRDSKVGILSVDGQIAKMEFEQFSTSDQVERGSISILQRHRGTESSWRPLSSSVSSVSGDEDTTDRWRTSEEITSTSTRYDVAVSALITPETWDKKVQFDSSNPR